MLSNSSIITFGNISSKRTKRLRPPLTLPFPGEYSNRRPCEFSLANKIPLELAPPDIGLVYCN